MTMIKRRCEGCGFQFSAQAGDGQRFCSTYCESAAGMAQVLAGLRRFTTGRSA